jgi:hypothetical protein
MNSVSYLHPTVFNKHNAIKCQSKSPSSKWPMPLVFRLNFFTSYLIIFSRSDRKVNKLDRHIFRDVVSQFSSVKTRVHLHCGPCKNWDELGGTKTGEWYFFKYFGLSRQ